MTKETKEVIIMTSTHDAVYFVCVYVLVSPYYSIQWLCSRFVGLLSGFCQ